MAAGSPGNAGAVERSRAIESIEALGVLDVCPLQNRNIGNGFGMNRVNGCRQTGSHPLVARVQGE
jgi:hypothetical protein